MLDKFLLTHVLHDLNCVCTFKCMKISRYECVCARARAHHFFSLYIVQYFVPKFASFFYINCHVLCLCPCRISLLWPCPCFVDLEQASFYLGLSTVKHHFSAYSLVIVDFKVTILLAYCKHESYTARSVCPIVVNFDVG